MQRETNRQNTDTPSKKLRATTTRTEGPKSYDEMLAEDDRKAKRVRNEDDEWFEEPTICLGIPRIKSIKISSLGPILKKRFVCAK